MQDLDVTLVQADTHWQAPTANLAMYDSVLSRIENSHLVILPEMFSTGFSMQPESLAEPMDGPTAKWMQDRANQHNRVIAGSVIIKENNQYFNRLLWTSPDKQLIQYDKRHLFRMAGEHEHYGAGTQPVVASVQGWKVCLQVCYDLRFPVWSRNRFQADQFDYDVLMYVANWPTPRRNAWRTLLAARAIENSAYVIGVNRNGVDGNEVEYSGDSIVVDYAGNCLLDLGQQPNQQTIKLSRTKLSDFRSKFPVHLDSDSFSLQSTD